ncbi:MAG: GDP-mannose 4,6-dehydratase [Thermodesulfobacteriota bacterium]|nr:GDP-mannose 4,6-dehydratase [Thermodesulfobacteriota bacterium]
MLTWLVTGGCGFIGTRLIDHLVKEKGHRIIVLDNLTVGTKEDLGAVCVFSESDSLNDPPDKQVHLIRGDIKDKNICLKASEYADVIVHLAANTGVGPSVEDPEADMQNNVFGTFNMLEAARLNKVGRFIFASSGAPVGECEPPIHEELAPHPVSPYGAGKLAGEGYCSAYYRTFGVETVALRFGNVYGPGSGRKNSVVAKFIKQAMNGETLEIYGDGTQTRDFIYIDDLITAIKLAQHTPGIGGETFQIATNRETTVGEMVDLLLLVLNENGITDVRVMHGEKRLGDVTRNFSDTSKARDRLNWTSRYDLRKGLKETVHYFLKRVNEQGR